MKKENKTEKNQDLGLNVKYIGIYRRACSCCTFHPFLKRFSLALSYNPYFLWEKIILIDVIYCLGYNGRNDGYYYLKILA